MLKVRRRVHALCNICRFWNVGGKAHRQCCAQKFPPELERCEDAKKGEGRKDWVRITRRY